MIYFLSPVLADDKAEYFNNIGFLDSFVCGSFCGSKYVVCIQDKDFDSSAAVELEKTEKGSDLVVLKTAKIGVSNARNICLEYSLNDSDNENDVFIFYDAKIVLSREFVSAIFSFEKQPHSLLMGDISFISESDLNKLRYELGRDLSGASKGASKGKLINTKDINLLKNCSVSKWAFKKSIFNELRFDLGWGPGVDTSYKSGEDALFFYKMCDSISSADIFKVECLVYRESRPSNLSKHYDYAFGHGAVLGLFLKRWPLRYMIYSFMFLCNSLRFYFGSGLSRKIALLRVYGFIHFLK